MSFKAMRERAGLTQTEVADNFGVDQSTVSAWESGKWLPRAKLLYPVAKLFHCTLDELLAPDQPRNEDVPF